jgi:hypothetical protein
MLKKWEYASMSVRNIAIENIAVRNILLVTKYE